MNDGEDVRIQQALSANFRDDWSHLPLVLPSGSALAARWLLLVARVVIFGGMTGILYVGGEWVWAAFFGALTLICVLVSWMDVSERLTLQETGFLYRLGFKNWRCDWSQCDVFEPVGRGRTERESVTIHWKDKGPFFSPFWKAGLTESELHSALGRRSAELASKMNRLAMRAREVEAE